MKKIFEELCEVTQKFNDYHEAAVPLCAAENVMSEFCKIPLSAGFQERYIMGSAYEYTSKDNFVGSEMLLPYYKMLNNECELQYHTKYNDVRTLTGMNCLTMIVMTLAQPGDKIMILDKAWGGHASVRGICERLGLEVYDIPYELEKYDFNYDLLNEQIETYGIKYIMPAPSDILFQLDLKRIDTTKALLLNDASQTLGLIGAGVLDNPIDYMDNIVMFGGTHKTIPGPAHGIAMTNNLEIFSKLDKGINPKYLRNTQMHQVISLLFTLIEQRFYGKPYQQKTVELGNMLGRALEDRGFTIAKKDGVYTQTHQIFLECGKEEMDRIYNNAIAVGMSLNTKKKELFHGGYGIRFGLQEVARYNWNEQDIQRVAEIVKIISKEDLDVTAAKKLSSEMSPKEIHYTFPEQEVNELMSVIAGKRQ